MIAGAVLLQRCFSASANAVCYYLVMKPCRLVLAICLCAACGGTPLESEENHDVFPGKTWLRYVDSSEAGWSAQALNDAFATLESSGASTLLVVENGVVVAEWGQTERRLPCRSVRKSYLSALYGAYLDDFDLDDTLAELGIEDERPLLDIERRATIKDLLTARSGVYHPAAASDEGWEFPDPGTVEPGTFWAYNNWDFNVAGAVFEQVTGRSLYDAFMSRLAAPLEMEHFRAMDGHYVFEPELSLYPAYTFRMSARDMARFGLLFLRNGRWRTQQIIPHHWVLESTKMVSQSNAPELGYGYMWWVVPERNAYFASGNGGHIIAVFPNEALVLVSRVDSYADESADDRLIFQAFDEIVAARSEPTIENPRLDVLPSRSTLDGTIRLDQATLSNYVGTYAFENNSWSIRLRNQGLQVVTQIGLFNLLPRSTTHFVIEDIEADVTFELGGSGVPVTMTVDSATAIRQ